MLLFGGSGHAKVIRDCVRASGGEVSFIFDDNPALTRLDETPVAGAYNPDFEKDQELILAIGDNQIRKRVADKIRHRFGKAVHPSAVLSSYLTIGDGTVVMQLAVINAGASVGKHCILNTASVTEHDCTLEDFVHISPNATLCGNVRVGEGTHVGAAAVILPNITVGKWCVIGAGTVVTDPVPDFSLVVGVPGKVIRTLALNV